MRPRHPCPARSRKRRRRWGGVRTVFRRNALSAQPTAVESRPQTSGAVSGGRTSVWAGRSATPTGQVTPLGPWLQ